MEDGGTGPGGVVGYQNRVLVRAQDWCFHIPGLGKVDFQHVVLTDHNGRKSATTVLPQPVVGQYAATVLFPPGWRSLVTRTWSPASSSKTHPQGQTMRMPTQYGCGCGAGVPVLWTFIGLVVSRGGGTRPCVRSTAAALSASAFPPGSTSGGPFPEGVGT